MNNKPSLKRAGLVVLAVFMGLSLYRCSNKSAAFTPRPVQEPFANVKLDAKTYTVDAAKGGEIKLENGTKITVPANAFVDKEGNTVSAPVELKYREFHTAADIIASGIPMKIQDGNEIQNFESAGMFQMEGYSGNSEVQVANGKQITVQMASFKAGDNYNFYYFDQEKNEWKEVEKAKKPEANTEKAEALKSLPEEPKRPIEPKPFDPNSTVLNLDVDYTKYPELKEFNGLMWQYAGTDPKNDPKNMPWLFEEMWTNMNLQLADASSSVFNLSVQAGKKSCETQVTPVLRGKSFEQAKTRYLKKLDEATKIMEARAKEAQRLERQADLVRSFQVSNFGIYNCDRYYSMPVANVLKSDFKFEDGSSASNIMVYHVNRSDNSVIYIYPGSKEFKYNPSQENLLVAVLPGDKLAIFDKEAFRELNSKNIPNGQNYTFNFHTMKRPVKDMDDLSEILKSI